MSDAADVLIEHCREAGQRITGPRRIIADVVAKADDHPDVTEIYRRVAAIDPGISLSTVYRTLKVFAATGLVERHSFAGGTRPDRARIGRPPRSFDRHRERRSH